MIQLLKRHFLPREFRFIALFIALVIALASGLNAWGLPNKCSQGLLLRGGEFHVTPTQLSVLIALEVSRNKQSSPFTILEPTLGVLKEFDQERFSNWRSDIHLFSVIKVLLRKGFVERGPSRKPTEWRISENGNAALSQLFRVWDKSFRIGETRRESLLDRGPLSKLYPGRNSSQNPSADFDDEFTLVFVTLNSLDLNRFVPAREIADRIKTDFPSQGFWVDDGKGAYPSAMRVFLLKLEKQGLIFTEEGAHNTLLYALSPEGRRSAYVLRAYVWDLFELLAKSTMIPVSPPESSQ